MHRLFGLMRIAITSRLYFPAQGGVPVYTRLLGNAFHHLGHEVRLLTSTPASRDVEVKDHFEVIRRHHPSSCLELARWCDLLLQVEFSLGLIWPFLLCRRPCFISYHTHFAGGGPPGFLPIAQRWLASRCYPISVSEVLRKSWGGHGVVIGNPYDDELFYPGAAPRSQELLFVGRLIPDKGCDVLLKALVRLRERMLFPKLSIIGDVSPHDSASLSDWQRLASRMGLADQVSFQGAQSSEKVAHAMRAARILVIPSTWQEPFGIVGLEGLASGCKVIASRHGGLKEACGEFATYFENGDDQSLAEVLIKVLQSDLAPSTARLADHLNARRALSVAESYLKHFEEILPRR